MEPQKLKTLKICWVSIRVSIVIRQYFRRKGIFFIKVMNTISHSNKPNVFRTFCCKSMKNMPLWRNFPKKKLQHLVYLSDKLYSLILCRCLLLIQSIALWDDLQTNTQIFYTI